MKVSVKREGKVVAFKIEVGRIKVPFRNLCMLMYETDMYKHWFPFTKESKRLYKTRETSQLTYFKVWCPPPISNRYSNMYGCGMNRLFTKHKSIVCMAKSIDVNGETEFMGIPLRHEGGYRMITHFFAFEI